MLVFHCGETDDNMVMQQGHHTVRVVNDVALSVIGGEGNCLIGPQGDLIPLLDQLIYDLYVSSWRQ